MYSAVDATAKASVDADSDDDQPVGLARKRLRKKKLRRAGRVEKHEALFLSRAAALDYRNALSAAEFRQLVQPHAGLPLFVSISSPTGVKL